MKKITKHKRPPKFLRDFQVHYPKRTYEDINGEFRNQIKRYLINEQFGLCCYCMKKIRPENSHNEHFIPRSKAPELSLDYRNLFASCNGFKDQRENCGHKKNNWFDSSLTISPLDSFCEKTFIYGMDGTISSYSPSGQEMIQQLELNNPLLIKARKTAIYEYLADEYLDEDTAEDYIHDLYYPIGGELEPFCMAIIYQIKKQF